MNGAWCGFVLILLQATGVAFLFPKAALVGRFHVAPGIDPRANTRFLIPARFSPQPSRPSRLGGFSFPLTPSRVLAFPPGDESPGYVEFTP